MNHLGNKGLTLSQTNCLWPTRLNFHEAKTSIENNNYQMDFLEETNDHTMYILWIFQSFLRS